MKDKIKKARDKAIMDLIGGHVYAISELAEGEAGSKKSFVLTFSHSEDHDNYQVFFYDDPEFTEHINEILLDSCDDNTERSVMEDDEFIEEEDA